MKERAQKEAREEREGNQHGTGAATSSQTADARAHGSRSLSGLRRTHDLRGYSGDALAVLTGRHRAYGYCHTERFLSQLAKAEGAEALTTALGSWTTQLWKAGSEGGKRLPVFTSMGTASPSMPTA